MPVPIRLGTSNAVENLRSLLTLSNNILQGDWKLAGNTAGVCNKLNSWNSWFFRSAEKMGLEKSREKILAKL